MIDTIYTMFSQSSELYNIVSQYYIAIEDERKKYCEQYREKLSEHFKPSFKIKV